MSGVTRETFVGRASELVALERILAEVRRGGSVLLTVRGRRQVGKSRLMSEFVRQAGVPQLFVTGSRQASLAGDLESFRQDVLLNGTLPGAELLARMQFQSWEQALLATRSALPPDSPAVVVLDEFPWLLRHDPGLEGTLQKLWDRQFEGMPVMLVLVGSDLSVMRMITQHDRPLFGRARQMVVRPLSVRDAAQLAGRDAATDAGAAEAVDAHLVTGGYPRLVQRWGAAGSREAFLAEQLADENTDVVTTAERVLEAEFPGELQAANVLRAIGAGERTFTAIAHRADVSAAGLTRSLDVLRDKHVVAVDLPLSSRPSSKLSRYRIDDPYLRFWLRFVEPALADIRRGRPDLAVARVDRDWGRYRGRAVEPWVRDALTRLAADDPVLGRAEQVGGWWPRSNDPEVDLVGIAPPDAAQRVAFVGSIKWRERSPFDDHDRAVLAEHRVHVPGAAAAPLVAVSRSGVTTSVDAAYSPVDLVAAWQ